MSLLSAAHLSHGHLYCLTRLLAADRRINRLIECLEIDFVSGEEALLSRMNDLVCFNVKVFVPVDIGEDSVLRQIIGLLQGSRFCNVMNDNVA